MESVKLRGSLLEIGNIYGESQWFSKSRVTLLRGSVWQDIWQVGSKIVLETRPFGLCKSFAAYSESDGTSPHIRPLHCLLRNPENVQIIQSPSRH